VCVLSECSHTLLQYNYGRVFPSFYARLKLDPTAQALFSSPHTNKALKVSCLLLLTKFHCAILLQIHSSLDERECGGFLREGRNNVHSQHNLHVVHSLRSLHNLRNLRRLHTLQSIQSTQPVQCTQSTYPTVYTVYITYTVYTVYIPYIVYTVYTVS